MAGITTAPHSPYRPGVSKEPPVFVGREAEMELFERMVEELHYNPRNLTITGLRGLGKSVVSKHMVQMARASRIIPVRREILPDFAEQHAFEHAVLTDAHSALWAISRSHRLAEHGRHLAQALLSTVQVSLNVASNAIGGVPVTVDLAGAAFPEISNPTLPFVDRLSQLYRRIGEVAQQAERGVIFIIDEAQFARNRPNPKASTLAQLMHCVGSVQEDDLPIGLVLIGLPSLNGIVQEASSHGERFLVGAAVIGALDDPSAVRALTEPAVDSGLPFAEGVAERIAKDCAGYPYFLQAYGDHVWRVAQGLGAAAITEEHYELARPGILSFIDRTFFDQRFTKVKMGADRVVLAAMGGPGSGTVPLATVARRLHGVMSRNQVDQVMLNLLADDVIYREARGLLCFTAPGFGDYLARVHPLRGELHAYETSRRHQPTPADRVGLT